VWSGEGRCILLKQVITSLESSTANDYDFLKLIDFGGKCLFVTAGRSGVVQAWSLDGNPIYRQLQVDAFVSAFNVCTTGQRLLAIMAARDGGKYRVGAWDVAQGEEITSAGRFMIESVEDKSIDYVAGIEYGQTTLLVGAMAHSFYRRITVWDLNSPPVHATLRAHGYPPREKIWSTNAARKITCMMTMRCDGLPVIVVGDEGGWITLWDAADGEVVLAYEAHRKAVAGLDSMQVAGKDVVISAGLEGTIAGTTVSRHDGKESSASETFTIEVGDRIRAIAALAGGRIVAGTEQGFLLFQIR
jgi:WD40 repeat protein